MIVPGIIIFICIIVFVIVGLPAVATGIYGTVKYKNDGKEDKDNNQTIRDPEGTYRERIYYTPDKYK